MQIAAAERVAQFHAQVALATGRPAARRADQQLATRRALRRRVVQFALPLARLAAQQPSTIAPAARISSLVSSPSVPAHRISIARLILDRRHDRRKVHERADNHALRQPRMVQRPRAVGRRDEHRPAADCFRRVFRRRIPQVEAIDQHAAASPPSTTLSRPAFSPPPALRRSRRNGTTSLAPDASAWQIVDRGPQHIDHDRPRCPPAPSLSDTCIAARL